MTYYTLGFIFNPELNRVLLIRKQRPDWQKGKHNGIGGKIDPPETSPACIVRETREECGLVTQEQAWMHLGKILSPISDVDIYTLVWNGSPGDVATLTDEEVGWEDVEFLPDTVNSNLRWLIPLAIDKIQHNEFSECRVYYHGQNE